MRNEGEQSKSEDEASSGGKAGGADKNAKQGRYVFPLGEFWDKGIGIEMGQAPVKRYNRFLRDLIVAGRVKPSQIITQRLSLDAASPFLSDATVTRRTKRARLLLRRL